MCYEFEVLGRSQIGEHYEEFGVCRGQKEAIEQACLLSVEEGFPQTIADDSVQEGGASIREVKEQFCHCSEVKMVVLTA